MNEPDQSGAPDIDKTNPSQDELLEVLEALRGEAINGRLKFIGFALVDPRMPDDAMVDHYGAHEISELAARQIVHRVADSVESANRNLATAIRNGLRPARTQH